MGYTYDVQYLDIYDEWITVGAANTLDSAAVLLEFEMKNGDYNGCPLRIYNNTTDEPVIETIENA